MSATGERYIVTNGAIGDRFGKFEERRTIWDRLMNSCGLNSVKLRGSVRRTCLHCILQRQCSEDRETIQSARDIEHVGAGYLPILTNSAYLPILTNCVFMSHPNIGVHAPSRCITQTVRQHRAIANFGISSRSSKAFISGVEIRSAFARSQFTLDAWSEKSAFDTNSVIGTGRCKPV